MLEAEPGVTPRRWAMALVLTASVFWRECNA